MLLGLVARVDDTADEATTDEGWDGDVALLEDGLRDARMVSVAYGHLADNPLMFSNLDTSAGSTEGSSRAQEVQERHWRPISTDFFVQVEELYSVCEDPRGPVVSMFLPRPCIGCSFLFVVRNSVCSSRGASFACIRSKLQCSGSVGLNRLRRSTCFVAQLEC